MRKETPPWLTPVDITKPDADEKIEKLGEEAKLAHITGFKSWEELGEWTEWDELLYQMGVYD